MSTTVYSKDIPGTEGNYNWSVRFDSTDGFLGITQMKANGEIERVLLSPRQVKALKAFVTRKNIQSASPAS